MPNAKIPGEKRDKAVTFRLSSPELERVRRAIQESMLSGPDWLLSQVDGSDAPTLHEQVRELQMRVDKLERGGDMVWALTNSHG